MIVLALRMMLQTPIPRSTLIEAYNSAYSKSTAYGRPSRCHKIFMNKASQFKNQGLASMLEISCGRGLVIKDFAFHGFNIWASEPCQYLLEHDLALDLVFPLMAHELAQIPSKFCDLVYSINVLDHMPNDEDVINIIDNSLRIAKVASAFIVNGDGFFQTYVKNLAEWVQLIKLRLKSSAKIESTTDKQSGCGVIFIWNISLQKRSSQTRSFLVDEYNANTSYNET